MARSCSKILLLLLGCAFAAAAVGIDRVERGLAGQPVNVRFVPGVSDASRAQLEQRLGLAAGVELEPRGTWKYTLLRRSKRDIRALVSDPLVEDTHHIDRSGFRVLLDAPEVPAPIRHVVEDGLGPWAIGLLAVLALVAFWMSRDIPLTLGRLAASLLQRNLRRPMLLDRLVAAVRQDRSTARRSSLALVLSTLLFGGLVALVFTSIGTPDLENYVHSFVSLDRGTRMEAVKVFGQPVYTLALGLGVRLPLLANLGASPAGLLAPHVPEPVTYWLMLALAIATPVLLARLALAPVCGPRIGWVAVSLLFLSLPMVNYTITDDWPETACSYAAVVAAVFAPHALLALGHARRPVVATLAVLGLVWGSVAIAHQGYWPILGLTLALSTGVAATRREYTVNARLGVAAALGATSLAAVGLLAPDVLRELQAAGALSDAMQRVGPRGPQGGLVSANAAVFINGVDSARAPFTFLLMTLSALVAGFGCRDPRRRRLTVGCAIVSIACGLGASTLKTSIGPLTPTAWWGLRDPAIGFAILASASAACTLASHDATPARWRRALSVFLLLGAAAGPFAAVRLAARERPLSAWFDTWFAPRGPMSAVQRLFAEGFPVADMPRGSRVALWPGLVSEFRDRRFPQSDFPDAGYVLVTATTKQRTMRQVAGSNTTLFEQSTAISAETLCNASIVQFLRLDYLVAPPPIACEEWRSAGTLAYDWSLFRRSGEADTRAWVSRSSEISAEARRAPALSPPFLLLATLSPRSGTNVTLGARDIALQLDAAAAESRDLSVVLPVAYDPSWTASSGRIQAIGGLLALVGATERRVLLTFKPDGIAVMRALAVVLAQAFVCLGLVGLAWAGPAAPPVSDAGRA